MVSILLEKLFEILDRLVSVFQSLLVLGVHVLGVLVVSLGDHVRYHLQSLEHCLFSLCGTLALHHNNRRKKIGLTGPN